jgi:hypothetical protein
MAPPFTPAACEPANTHRPRDHMATKLPLASRALALILAGILGCGSDLLLPDPPDDGPVQFSIVTGDDQVGVVGEQLGEPLVVEVLTGRGLPATGQEVEFIFTDSAGVVTPSRAVTNSAGRASANWQLGTEPGAMTVVAQMVVVGDAEPQAEEFTAEAKPAAPDKLSAKSPTSQPGRRGQSVADQPVVQVVDRFGNPVPQVPVAWQVITGEGTVSEAISTTTEDGTSTVDWTLGNWVGVQRLTATVGPITGSPVSFTANVLF